MGFLPCFWVPLFATPLSIQILIITACIFHIHACHNGITDPQEKTSWLLFHQEPHAIWSRTIMFVV